MIILYPSSGASDGFFNGVPVEERLHWRSFLVKLGADNLKGGENEELLVACHKLLLCLNRYLRNALCWRIQCFMIFFLKNLPSNL
ncbi:hypothetical protein UlMin_030920 [Ulmus minor]